MKTAAADVSIVWGRPVGLWKGEELRVLLFGHPKREMLGVHVPRSHPRLDLAHKLDGSGARAEELRGSTY